LGRRPPTRTADQFALSGPSERPDPEFHAYRKDLADIALAGRVIASHYAAPAARTLARDTALCDAPAADAGTLQVLPAGEPFELLEESLGWAWGYAGKERRVGYVESAALG